MKLRLALALCALSIVSIASASRAGVASGSASSLPSFILIVGCQNGEPDVGQGGFTIIVNHADGAPWAEGPVWVDLSSCADCRVATYTLHGQTRPGACPSVSPGFTPQSDGSVHMVVAGASTGRAGTPGPALAKIYADGVMLGSVPVATLDLDGQGGLGANDLSIWLADFGSQQFIGRSDFDFSGDLGANDLSLWLDAFGKGGSGQSSPSLCP